MIQILFFIFILQLHAEELILVLEKNEDEQIHSFSPFRFNECYITGDHSSIEFIQNEITSEMITIQKYTGRFCERMNLKVSFNSTQYNQDVISGYLGFDIVSLYVGERPVNTLGCVGVKGVENCEKFESTKRRCYTDALSPKGSEFYYQCELDKENNYLHIKMYYSTEFHYKQYVRTERMFKCNVCDKDVQYECF